MQLHQMRVLRSDVLAVFIVLVEINIKKIK